MCVRVGRWVKLHARCGIPPSRMRCCCTDCLQSTRGASFKGRQRHSKGVPLVSVCVCARVWASLCVSPARSWLHLSTTRMWRCVCMCIAWVAATCMRLVGGKKSLSPQAARIRPVCMLLSQQLVCPMPSNMSAQRLCCAAHAWRLGRISAPASTQQVCAGNKKSLGEVLLQAGGLQVPGCSPCMAQAGCKKGLCVCLCHWHTRV